ncbi:MAG: 6,7-dimethyl-8-ribityllumazine synthase [candidate division Zixibacteria bacterium]|nr:6,7-dimethyl-8-ribityllumazine synthase [candidate division Zixibacteria bacterium]NIR65857.1 6,7-dimethyl-8-ribityllumazine synthase [candidate division Zixibacteria bacterium]NIS16495.1 6,7-dimethyl-8-ribityllumazine synthase [candidate division Zixibacteria bacterium]NIS47511.1 6,7-dimethyl-8-ribityllumazine synthase [candidate division Zixibacteria bacterium]NIT52868.1 6,7-dimethyl-8-ribityllumazine synthase [candidate division Zixibacteria bacterium]
MAKIHEGKLDAKGLKFGIIVSRFNDLLTAKLQEGALDCLVRHNAASEDVEVFKVPGSFEIPYVANHLAKSKKFDAIICLGALIRGHTPHFEYIAAEVSKGIANISMATGLPVIYGVVTADTLEQGIERCGTKAGNRGWDAAQSAIEMANLYRESLS